MVENLEFRISTGLKDIIGKELITNDFIAIFELVKNAYDANANKVEIVFQNLKSNDKNNLSKILVIDDGDGMSKTEIIDKFLFVGYSDKKDFEKKLAESEDFRDKIQKRRFFAGAKGVGRFSCDRLGKKLNLYSKKENENKIHVLEINWNVFEYNQKEEFRKKKIKYYEMEKLEIKNLKIKDFKQGTILEICPLRTQWTHSELVRLKRHLQRLINPAQVNETDEFKIILKANDFLEEDKKYDYEKEYWNVVNGPIKNFIFEKLGIKTTEVICGINKQGTEIFTKLIDKGKFIFSIKEKNNYTDLKDIKTTIFYLNENAKRTFSLSMGIPPVQFGSIFLYKNGIRIQPYGDEGDDWLGLNKRKTQGTRRYLATREIMGRIELYGAQLGLKEVTSRDAGVVKTKEYKFLKEFFIEKALRRLERFIVEAIEWEKITDETDIRERSLQLIRKLAGQVKDPDKNVEFNKDLLKIMEEKEKEKIPEYLKNLEQLQKHVKSTVIRNKINLQIKVLRKAVKSLEKEKKEAERALEIKKKESLFLEEDLSREREIIRENEDLNHSIRVATFSIAKLIDQLNKKIMKQGDLNAVISFIDEIALENKKIKILSSYVRQATFDTKVETIERDIVLYVGEYLDRIISKRYEDIKINFINHEIEHLMIFKPMEISIILDNFIDNATKAGANSFTVKFEIIKNKIHFFISDNGKGVDDNNKNKIFTRGFSMTRGTGIGLYHIRKLIKSMDGEVRFIGNNIEGLEKGACFEVVLK